MAIKKINEFPNGSGSLSADDIFLFMDDPSDTGTTKKISLSDLSSAIGGGSEVNDLSSVVTWANVPDANITESSVVQHSGALQLTASQIVDFQISGVAHNDILVYNSGTSLWENNNKVVFSDTTGITGASGVNNIVQISQSDYDNLASYTPNTIYFIT